MWKVCCTQLHNWKHSSGNGSLACVKCVNNKCWRAVCWEHSDRGHALSLSEWRHWSREPLLVDGELKHYDCSRRREGTGSEQSLSQCSQEVPLFIWWPTPSLIDDSLIDTFKVQYIGYRDVLRFRIFPRTFRPGIMNVHHPVHVWMGLGLRKQAHSLPYIL